jgi:hypothetical protein
VVALEGQGLFDGFVNDLVEIRLVGIAELFEEGAEDRFRALDQVVVAQDQVAGEGCESMYWRGWRYQCRVISTISSMYSQVSSGSVNWRRA